MYCEADRFCSSRRPRLHEHGFITAAHHRTPAPSLDQLDLTSGQLTPPLLDESGVRSIVSRCIDVPVYLIDPPQAHKLKEPGQLSSWITNQILVANSNALIVTQSTRQAVESLFRDFPDRGRLPDVAGPAHADAGAGDISRIAHNVHHPRVGPDIRDAIDSIVDHEPGDLLIGEIIEVLASKLMDGLWIGPSRRQSPAPRPEHTVDFKAPPILIDVDPPLVGQPAHAFLELAEDVEPGMPAEHQMQHCCTGPNRAHDHQRTLNPLRHDLACGLG